MMDWLCAESRPQRLLRIVYPSDIRSPGSEPPFEMLIRDATSEQWLHLAVQTQVAESAVALDVVPDTRHPSTAQPLGDAGSVNRLFGFQRGVMVVSRSQLGLPA